MVNGTSCFHLMFLPRQLCKLESTSLEGSWSQTAIVVLACAGTNAHFCVLANPITVKSCDPGVTTLLSVWDSSNGTAMDIGSAEDGTKLEKLRRQHDKLHISRFVQPMAI